MSFSNLALTNRGFSGQANYSNTDYPTSAKPRTLSATQLQRRSWLLVWLTWAKERMIFQGGFNQTSY